MARKSASCTNRGCALCEHLSMFLDKFFLFYVVVEILFIVVVCVYPVFLVCFLVLYDAALVV